MKVRIPQSGCEGDKQTLTRLITDLPTFTQYVWDLVACKELRDQARGGICKQLTLENKRQSNIFVCACMTERERGRIASK